MTTVDELIADMKAGKPLQRSEELNALARQVVRAQQERANEDINTWARALAERLAVFTD